MKIYFFCFLILFLSLVPLESKAQKVHTQTGTASYYSDKFIGRKTASGEKYSSKLFTAAHRTLPFNTILKVTNLNNGETVFVKVNDRGPYSRKRILDVSKAAAEKLKIKGVAKVQIEEVTPDHLLENLAEQ